MTTILNAEISLPIEILACVINGRIEGEESEQKWKAFCPPPLTDLQNVEHNKISLNDLKCEDITLTTTLSSKCMKLTFSRLHFYTVNAKHKCHIGIHQIETLKQNSETNENAVKPHNIAACSASVDTETIQVEALKDDEVQKENVKRKRGRPKKGTETTGSKRPDAIERINSQTNFQNGYTLRGRKLNDKIMKAEHGVHDSDESDTELYATAQSENELDNDDNWSESTKENYLYKKLKAEEELPYRRNKEVICKLCSKMFCDKNGLFVHVKRLHSKHNDYEEYINDLEQLVFVKCFKCNYLCTDNIKLMFHELKEHSDAEFSCKLCDENFESGREMQQHLKAFHMRDDERNFTCELCSARFKSKGSLKQHLDSVHKMSRAFKCKTCEKSFFTNSQLNRHLKIHEVDRKKTYQCDTCKKEFLHRYNLNRHIETVHASQSEKWHCSYCGKGFGAKLSMISHVKVVHFNMYPYECRVCKEHFLKYTSLFDHLSTVHGQNIVNIKQPAKHSIYNRSDDEKHYCSYCSKEFLHKIRLIEHMHTDHSEAFPCKCEPCNQGFLKRVFLVKHSLKAHGTLLTYDDNLESADETSDIMRIIGTKQTVPSRVDSTTYDDGTSAIDQDAIKNEDEDNTQYFIAEAERPDDGAVFIVDDNGEPQHEEKEAVGSEATGESQVFVEVANGDQTFTYMIETSGPLEESSTLSVAEQLANILMAAEQTMQQEDHQEENENVSYVLQETVEEPIDSLVQVNQAQPCDRTGSLSDCQSESAVLNQSTEPNLYQVISTEGNIQIVEAVDISVNSNTYMVQ
ncbi:zinc finger protein 320-like isoform X2 [Mya arenaria]|uniref:zinc finger protein 320-like isoform X2 n=1 Tax=Mya arenaria TaxID=6604 RepID=UPI0022E8B708|nr:zinc finger protein 320-like isoform X2 [Mya arenaria]